MNDSSPNPSQERKHPNLDFFGHRFWSCGKVILDTGVHKKPCWYNIKFYKHFWQQYIIKVKVLLKKC